VNFKLKKFTKLNLSIFYRFSEPITSALPVSNGSQQNETSNLLRRGYNVTTKGFFLQLFRYNSSSQPTNISMTVVGVMITCYCLVSLGLALLISYQIDSILGGETWALVTLIVLATLLLIFCLFISIQPRQVFVTRVKPFMVKFFD
jgi:hypothetical protein